MRIIWVLWPFVIDSTILWRKRLFCGQFCFLIFWVFLISVDPHTNIFLNIAFNKNLKSVTNLFSTLYMLTLLWQLQSPSGEKYIYNKFLRTKTTTNLPKSGRPSKCTVQEKSIYAATQRRTPFLLPMKSQHHVICSIKFPYILLRGICVIQDFLEDWQHVSRYYRRNT